MSKNTLLAFLTQRTPPEVTKEFQRVFSDLTKDEKKAVLLDIIDETRKQYGTKPDLKVPKFLKKFADLRSPDAKQIDKLLQMSPSDIDNLFKVMKSPSNADLLKKLDPETRDLLQKEGLGTEKEGVGEVEISALLTPIKFKEPISGEEINARLEKFGKDLEKAGSKGHPAAISYNPNSYDFSFKGDYNSFKLLEEKLGLQAGVLKAFKEGPKEKLKEIDSILNPNMLANLLSSVDIQRRVKNFVKKYPYKITYNPETYDFSFKGDKEVLDLLAKSLRIRPTALQYMEEGKVLNLADFEQRYKLVVEGEKSVLTAPKPVSWVQTRLKEFKKKYADVIKTLTYENEILTYKGPRKLLPFLFKYLSVKEEVADSLLEGNFESWQLRFKPYKNLDYLTSWMEDMNEGSPKFKEKWDKISKNITDMSSLTAGIKWEDISEEEGESDYVLKFQGSLTQLFEVLSGIFEKEDATKVMEEIKKNKSKFKVG